MNGDQLAEGSSKALKNNQHIRNKHNLLHGKVDINDLLTRVREGEKKQKKENLIFFGLVASVVAITGIIASL